MSPEDFLALVARLPVNVTEFAAEGFSVKLQPLAVNSERTPSQLLAEAKLKEKNISLIDSLTALPPDFRD